MYRNFGMTIAALFTATLCATQQFASAAKTATYLWFPLSASERGSGGEVRKRISGKIGNTLPR